MKTIKTMKMMIKRTLEQTLSITAVWLLLGAGGPANAAELLGLDFAVIDTADTANIILFDTAAGTSISLGDTGLTRCSDDHTCTFPGLSPNGEFGPNGIAYNEVTGVAYYAAIPNFGGTRTLWSMAIDPQPPGPPESLGPLDGTPRSATWFDGLYWYVADGTLALHAVSFTAGGSLLADTFVGVLPLLSAGATGLEFGDVSVDEVGLLYGSADIVGGVDDGKVLLFTVLLTNPDPVSTYMELSIDTDPKMELAFGGDGTLFGLTSDGTLRVVLFDGGPLTDLASINIFDDDDECGDSPRTQGFWRRICRKPHPEQSDLSILTAELCEDLNPDPHSDPCERARSQCAAVKYNVASARLAESCIVDSTGESVAEAIAAAEALIAEGTNRSCKDAQALCAAINEGGVSP